MNFSTDSSFFLPTEINIGDRATAPCSPPPSYATESELVSRRLFFSLLVYYFTFAASASIMYGEKYNEICRTPSLALKATWFYLNNGVESRVDDCQMITNTNSKNEVTFCQESVPGKGNHYTTKLAIKAASFSDARMYTCKDSDGQHIKRVYPDVISEY